MGTSTGDKGPTDESGDATDDPSFENFRCKVCRIGLDGGVDTCCVGLAAGGGVGNSNSRGERKLGGDGEGRATETWGGFVAGEGKAVVMDRSAPALTSCTVTGGSTLDPVVGPHSRLPDRVPGWNEGLSWSWACGTFGGSMVT